MLSEVIKYRVIKRALTNFHALLLTRQKHVKTQIIHSVGHGSKYVP